MEILVGTKFRNSTVSLSNKYPKPVLVLFNYEKVFPAFHLFTIFI